MKKLLEIALEHYDDIDREGLCFLSNWLFRKKIFNQKEYINFNQLIESNSPLFKYLFNQAFYWRPYRVTPRKRWLRRQLRKCKDT